MFEARPADALTVNSLYFNAELLLAEARRPTTPWALGLRWSFGLPDLTRVELSEYTLPLHPVPLTELLTRRGGITIRSYLGEPEDALYAHLAGGHPAIVAVDSYDLPYRPAYGRVHSGRTIIVRALPGDRSCVLAEDWWPPVFRGPLAVADLERARRSRVPHDPQLEPVFSGVPIAGAWWSVEATGVPELRGHAATLLSELQREAALEGATAHGIFGLSAIDWLCTQVAEATNPMDPTAWRIRRAASLVLRAELSARVYLCATLRVLAHVLSDSLLLAETRRFCDALGDLELARDVLVKSLALWRPIYCDIAMGCLTRARDAEKRLLDIVAVCVEAETSTPVVDRFAALRWSDEILCVT